MAGNLAHIFVCANPAHPHNLGPRDVWPPISVKPRLLCIQPTLASLCVSLVKDAWPLAPWVMALNPAHPGNLGSLGAPFLQLHVARLCPLEPTLATLPPTTPATIFFFNLGFRAPRNLPTLPSGSGPTVDFLNSCEFLRWRRVLRTPPPPSPLKRRCPKWCEALSPDFFLTNLIFRRPKTYSGNFQS